MEKRTGSQGAPRFPAPLRRAHPAPGPAGRTKAPLPLRRSPPSRLPSAWPVGCGRALRRCGSGPGRGARDNAAEVGRVSCVADSRYRTPARAAPLRHRPLTRRPHWAGAPPRSGPAGVLRCPGHGAAAAQRVEGRGRRAGPRQGVSGPAGRSKALGARGCRGGRPLPGCGPRCPHPAERHPEPRLHLGWVHPALFQPPAPRGGAGRRRPIRRRMQR